jgi:hypothetical protein
VQAVRARLLLDERRLDRRVHVLHGVVGHHPRREPSFTIFRLYCM